jgi:protocatechuate 3,4-dioxygenase beta subunit
MMKNLRMMGLSMTIGLTLILTACSAPATTTLAPVIATVQSTQATSPTALPPTQASTQPLATTLPTAAVLTPTASAAEAPTCTGTPTPAQTEGPYFTPNSPEKTSLLEAGMGGTKLLVTGYVMTKDCKPVANAKLDFWQADDKGAYDNAGYRLRGHLFTDAQGRYQLETIKPGEYPGRTEHIHVKVQAPNGPILTTQVYFPGVPANDRDSIFDPKLLADVQDTANGKTATFNFVINTQ